jgi:hypothetical protein
MLGRNREMVGGTQTVEQSGGDNEATVNDSILGRRLDLTSVPVVLVAWFAIFVVAIGIRLIGRTTLPLAPGESRIARDAWALLRGNDLTGAADAYPALVQLTSFLMFLFGETDFVARLLPLVSSIGVLVTLFWLRTWFGELPALSIALLWGISPVMTVSALRLDGGMPLVLASLLILTLTMTLTSNPNSAKAVILGIAVAIGVTIHPLGWLIVPLTLFPAMALIRDFRFGGRIWTVVGSFVAAFLVVTTWFGTRLTAPIDFLTESAATLVSDYLAGVGSQWSVPLAVMLIDEPLIVPLTLVGVGIAAYGPSLAPQVQPAIVLSIGIWTMPILVVGILATSSGPDRIAITLFPLILSAGLGLATLLDLAYRANRDYVRPLLWAGVALALLIAIFRSAELLATGPEGNLTTWVLNLGALAILILFPLTYVVVRISAGTGWSLVPVGALLVVVILGAIGLRTSLLMHDTTQDRPGEILLAGSSTPAVGQIERRLTTYSRDVTSEMREVRDPTGGHALMIVVQDDLTDPFAWYFRDFPNLSIVEDESLLPENVSPDVIFAKADRAEEWNDRFQEHSARTYHHRNVVVNSGDTTDRLVFTALNPVEFANVFNFAMYRDSPRLIERESMVVMLREDHAEVLWGSSEDE